MMALNFNLLNLTPSRPFPRLVRAAFAFVAALAGLLAAVPPIAAAATTTTAPSRTEVGAAYSPSDPLLPLITSFGASFSLTALDATAGAAASLRWDGGTAFTAVASAGTATAADAPFTAVSSFSIGLSPTYSTSPSVALPFRVRSAYPLTITVSLAALSAAFTVNNRSGAGTLFTQRTVYETSVDKAGTASDMALDPLCNSGSSTTTLFKCCAKTTNVYSVYYLATNSTTVACTLAANSTTALSGYVSTSSAINVTASLGATATAGVASDLSIVSTVTASAGSSLNVASFSDAVPTVAAYAALKKVRHIVNATVSFAAGLLQASTAGLTVLAADPTLSFCRTGDAGATTITNATLPFLVPGYAFGTSRNHIGYAAATYATDKQCAAPLGYYTTIGTNFDPYDQLSNFRSAGSLDAAFGPYCGVSNTGGKVLVDGTTSVLQGWLMSCRSIGPIQVTFDVSFALAAAAPLAIARAFPVLRVTDSFAGAPSVMSDLKSVLVTVALDVMNVEEFASTAGSTVFSSSHIATNCADGSATSACSVALAASTFALSVVAPAALPNPGGVLPFSTTRVLLQRWIPVATLSSAVFGATTYLQVVEVTALQTVSVSVPWVVNVSAVLSQVAAMQQAVALSTASTVKATSAWTGQHTAWRTTSGAAPSLPSLRPCAGLVDVSPAANRCTPLGSDAACASRYPVVSLAIGAPSRAAVLNLLGSSSARRSVTLPASTGAAQQRVSRPVWDATLQRCSPFIGGDPLGADRTLTTTISPTLSKPIPPPTAAPAPSTPAPTTAAGGGFIAMPAWYSTSANSTTPGPTTTTSTTAPTTTTATPTTTTPPGAQSAIRDSHGADVGLVATGAVFVSLDSLLLLVALGMALRYKAAALAASALVAWFVRNLRGAVQRHSTSSVGTDHDDDGASPEAYADPDVEGEGTDDDEPGVDAEHVALTIASARASMQRGASAAAPGLRQRSRSSSLSASLANASAHVSGVSYVDARPFGRSVSPLQLSSALPPPPHAQHWEVERRRDDAELSHPATGSPRPHPTTEPAAVISSAAVRWREEDVGPLVAVTRPLSPSSPSAIRQQQPTYSHGAGWLHDSDSSRWSHAPALHYHGEAQGLGALPMGVVTPRLIG